MNVLIAHGKLASLCDANFQDWRLGIDPQSEAKAVAQEDFPADATALASISGGLEDLPNDADDESLLELVRHGIVLFGQRIISEQQYMAERAAVVNAVLAWGDSLQAEMDHATKMN